MPDHNSEPSAEPASTPPYPVGHYYSPYPDPHHIQPPPIPTELPRITLHLTEQLALLEQLGTLQQTDPLALADRYYHWPNPSFNTTDATLLSAMVRHLQPARIVEIGSGMSSLVLVDTIKQHLPIQPSYQIVDPYPSQLLAAVTPADAALFSVDPRPVQEVGLRYFAELQPGDVLFIDSSHVVKHGSDLATLFFDVLPMLPSGVIVHFHDVFWPFEYPADWLRQLRAWNEIYMLRGMLQSGDRLKIRLFAHYLCTHHFPAVQRAFPHCHDRNPGSLWLEIQ